MSRKMVGRILPRHSSGHACLSIHTHRSMLRDLAASLGGSARRSLLRAQEELWTQAVPEQQKLTIQLCRNSIYFVLSAVLIRFFGDQLAV